MSEVGTEQLVILPYIAYLHIVYNQQSQNTYKLNNPQYMVFSDTDLSPHTVLRL